MTCRIGGQALLLLELQTISTEFVFDRSKRFFEPRVHFDFVSTFTTAHYVVQPLVWTKRMHSQFVTHGCSNGCMGMRMACACAIDACVIGLGAQYIGHRIHRGPPVCNYFL